ncbi:MAG: AMP-binding protein [SAR324 cluster bacterium]|uniref:AMP-binding protein n=1 Tax=SAR324 cluster bacterium TaxID=2024889 RepID=A0A7X9FQY4_9DELT|nr:AMP-binding protein [SAR324 cluster bacterium]
MDQSKPLNLDPMMMVDIIQHLQVEYSFGSPSLWNKIADYALRTGKALPSLKSVFMAGAPVSSSVLSKVSQIVTEGEVYTPYGSTEALPVTLAPSKHLKSARQKKARSGEQGTLVGKAISQVNVKVIEANDLLIEDIGQIKECPELEIGEIIVKGRNISQSYFARPEANAESKIRDGEVFWHRMGDLGYLDGSGNLYFCGRKAHAVKTQDKIFYSVPCERIFNEHPKVRRSALVAIEGGKKAAIVIEPISDAWPSTEEAKRRFQAELLAIGARDPITEAITDFFFHPSFPVDGRHNVKIFRDQLSKWASSQNEGFKA